MPAMKLGVRIPCFENPPRHLAAPVLLSGRDYVLPLHKADALPRYSQALNLAQRPF